MVSLSTVLLPVASLLFLACAESACSAAAAAAAAAVRFDLAIQLGDLEVAADIGNTLDTPAKWRQLGESLFLLLESPLYALGQAFLSVRTC
jgi:hypothetical protein